MNNRFERTEYLIGSEEMDKLRKSKVAVFGIGGVGSFAAEALVRSGIGSITLIDYDIIDISNINRQIHATDDTVGLLKTEVMKQRLLSINPELIVTTENIKFSKETLDLIEFTNYDYIVDAIDMISSKLLLIESAKSFDIPIISAMGAGNKLDPTKLTVGDIYSTEYCPLARVMRRELKKRNIDSLKVVWSKEISKKINLQKEDKRKAIPTSAIFVPATSGLIIASEIVRDLTHLEV